MSEIYTLEPPCRGRVILHTTEGELDVRLWSSQCPRAVRNFVQLCLEGYYNNCIFHRIIPQFMVQTGDPSGTGNGGESIYGEPFENEIMSRLKFRYRGMVGMANTGGKHSNGSQFFITLERADILNGKYTLFGKVDGPTIYNLMKIGQVEVNPANDRPLHPPKITNVEVLVNPFPDIQPRLLAMTEQEQYEEEKQDKVNEQLTVKKKCLLSFDDSDEDVPTRRFDKKSKSAHDLLNDPKLSKKAVEISSTPVMDLMTSQVEPEKSDPDEEQHENEVDEAEERKREIKELRKQLKRQKRDQEVKLEGYGKGDYLTRREMKMAKQKDNIMDRLSAFTKRLSQLSKDTKLANKESQETDEDLADGSWFAGKKLQFSIDSVKAYEVDAAKDTLDVIDPLSGKDNKLQHLANLKAERMRGYTAKSNKDDRW